MVGCAAPHSQRSSPSHARSKSLSAPLSWVSAASATAALAGRPRAGAMALFFHLLFYLFMCKIRVCKYESEHMRAELRGMMMILAHVHYLFQQSFMDPSRVLLKCQQRTASTRARVRRSSGYQCGEHWWENLESR